MLCRRNKSQNRVSPEETVKRDANVLRYYASRRTLKNQAVAPAPVGDVAMIDEMVISEDSDEDTALQTFGEHLKQTR